MTPAGCLLTSLAVFVLSAVQVQTCSEAGKFGPQCAYTCHCSVQCFRSSGQCPGRCVQPWSGPSCQRENVAYRKTTNTSGAFEAYKHTGSNAVDGNRKQISYRESCYHSNRFAPLGSGTRALEAWFYVDLGRTYHTRHITVYGRNDFDGSPPRLNNTLVFVSNTPNDRDNPCYTFTGQSPRGDNVVDLTCDREGRYVTLYDNHIPPNDGDPSAFMEICELEVYVCSIGSYGPQCDKLCRCSNGLACDDVTGRCPQGCTPGFQGESCSLHVDECAQTGDVCAENTTCVNTPGSFLCVPLNQTADVDECAQTGDVCGENATCVNTPGSFLCVPLNQGSDWSQAEVAWLVGGVASAAVLLLLLQAALFLFCLRRRGRQEQESTYDTTERPEIEMASIYSSIDGPSGNA